mgnify:CR=1 FL=1
MGIKLFTILRNLGEDKYLKYLMLVPAVSILAFVTIYPFIYSIYLSLYKVTIQNYFNPPFYGLGNYIEELTSLHFWNSIKVTLTYTALSVLIEFIAGLILAIIFYEKIGELDSWWKKILVTVLLAPMMLAPAIVGVIYRMMLNELIGIIPAYLKSIGIYIPLLTDPTLALLTLVLIDAWQWSPFMFLVIFSGLHSLPSEPVQAAMVDGASKLQIYKYIVLPLLSPIIAVAIIFRALDAVKAFDTIFLITAGGPGTATETISMYIYHRVFTQGDFGAGAAITIITLLLLTLICKFLLKFLYKVS